MTLKGCYIKVGILYLLVIFFTGIEISYCQITNSGSYPDINEKIWIHTDRNFYIAGERVWFRIYLMAGSSLSTGGISRVAYAELLSNSNEPILRQKVKTDPSGGAGYLDIPLDIPSGYYFIRAYTSWMKNYDVVHYFVSALIIVNPTSRLYKYRDTALIQDTAVEDDNATEWDTLMKIKLKEQSNGNNVTDIEHLGTPQIIVHNIQQAYKRREKVELEILTTGKNGNPLSSDISVAVSYSGDKVFNPPGVQHYLSSYSGTNPGSEIKSTSRKDHLYIPELEGLTLSGTIMESSGQKPLEDIPVILSIVGENAFVKSYLARTDGRFCFGLDDLYGENDVVLTYNSVENGQVIFIDEPYSQDFVKLPVMESNLDESWRSFIEKQLINYQITTLYPGGRSSFKVDSNSLQGPFYIKPDITVRMEDYIRLPNMEEVFRELVKQVLVTKESGKLTLNVLDINTNRIIGLSPLLILDGVPLFDSGLIFELNSEDVRQISVVCHKYYKGILEMDGIIDIITNKADLPVSELPENYSRRSFQGYQYPQKYLSPDYSDEQKLKSRIPDFRNLLYWNPSIKTDSEGRTYISFYTSDNTGNYSISIAGISSEGLLTPISYSFNVIK